MLILLMIKLVILVLGNKDALRLNYLIGSMAIEWIAVLSEHLKNIFTNAVIYLNLIQWKIFIKVIPAY